jgi:hypothetical protein
MILLTGGSATDHNDRPPRSVRGTFVPLRCSTAQARWLPQEARWLPQEATAAAQARWLPAPTAAASPTAALAARFRLDTPATVTR